MNLQDIRYTKPTPQIALATLNRPNKLNAFRNATYRELINILDDFEKDKELRVLIITGTGRAFSAGADLAELDLNKASKVDPAQIEKDLEVMQDLTRKLIQIPKPIIAAMNGLAVGVGVEISMASDIRVCSGTTYVSFKEVKRALFQTNGSIFILPRLIGLGRAMELFMTGRKIFAPELKEIGFVSAVYSPEDFMDKVMELATELSKNAPISLKLIKKHTWSSFEKDLETTMKEEILGMLECYKSEDMAEGMRSFLEKRVPNYRGK